MTESRVRVSCGILCRIQLDGKYLLLLNENNRIKGKYSLTPVGGALEVEDWKYLSAFDYFPEKADSKDLRIQLNANQLDDFRQWFYTRQQRERHPLRELYEELVLESQILPNLRRDDFTTHFLRIIEDSRQTSRHGQTGLWTHYFHEIHEVTFTANDLVLLLKSATPQMGVLFLDEATIRAGQSIPMFVDNEERLVEISAAHLFKDGKSTLP
jgi:hypothetical protein